MIWIFLTALILFFLIFSLLNSLNSKEKIELDFSNLDKQVVSGESENQEEFEDEMEEFVEFSDELGKKIWDLENENRNLKLENITLKERLNLAKPSDSKFENQSLSIEIN